MSMFFFFKQKTAYELRISDWSSDVCSSDLKLVVPIIPDEGRTFGMEAMFRSLGIYSIVGQKYKPEDADQLAFYKEDIKGQILEEGITEEIGRASCRERVCEYV